MFKVTATGTSILALLILTLSFGNFAEAGIIDDLKDKIANRATEIDRLEKEIKQTTEIINAVQAESQNLSNSIRSLDLTQKKLLTDIEITRQEIESTELTIEKIQYEILQTEQNIYIDNARIINLLQTINEAESQSLMEVMLGNDELIDFWNDVEGMQRLRDVVRNNVKDLEAAKIELQEKEKLARIEREELVSLDNQYSDQKSIVDSNKRTKTALLNETKNEERTYKKILSAKLEAKEAFEKEISDYEAQLKIIIDASKLPEQGSGVIGWPLADISTQLCSKDSSRKNCATQYFGNTAFAKSGAYNGSGHNGMDFRAAVGTPIYATESGTVAGVGNTDQYPGCYSYGKWILMTHDNGLSSLYAHLSLIKASEGQYIRRGDLIGYSGNTGYSTGPHLHFSIYATEGVSIVRLGDIKKITNCGQAYIPVASYNAYMNPLDYL